MDQRGSIGLFFQAEVKRLDGLPSHRRSMSKNCPRVIARANISTANMLALNRGASIGNVCLHACRRHDHQHSLHRQAGFAMMSITEATI